MGQLQARSDGLQFTLSTVPRHETELMKCLKPVRTNMQCSQPISSNNQSSSRTFRVFPALNAGCTMLRRVPIVPLCCLLCFNQTGVDQYHPTNGLMESCILIGYATRGLLVVIIEQRNSPVFLSFFPPNKYFFNLHLLTLLLPFSRVILKQLDPSPSRATGQQPIQLRLMGY